MSAHEDARAGSAGLRKASCEQEESALAEVMEMPVLGRVRGRGQRREQMGKSVCISRVHKGGLSGTQKSGQNATLNTMPCQ